MTAPVFLLALCLATPPLELDPLDGARRAPREISNSGTRQPPAQRTLTLSQALTLARNNNPDLAISKAREEKARFLYRKAWSKILPTAGFSFGGELNDKRVWLPLGAPGRDDDIKLQGKLQWNLTAGFRWVIFDGPDSAGVQLADSLGDLAAAKAERTGADLEQQVTRSFYSILALQRQIDVQRTATSNAETHQRAVARRTPHPDDADALRAETAVMAERYALSQNEHARRLAVLALSVLLGERHEENTQADRWLVPPAKTATPKADFATALARAQDQRLDLKQYRLEHTIAGRRKLQTYTRYLPRFVAMGSYVWQDTPGFYGEPRRWTLGMGMEWDILSSGQHYWDLQRQEREVRVSELAVTKTLTSIDWEVTAALIDDRAADAHLRASRRWAHVATRAAAAIQKRYVDGKATQLEVLLAATEATRASTAENVSQLSMELAALAVERVVRTPQGQQ